MELDDKQQEIYSRQIQIKEIGKDGQQKLAKASVLVVGCGGLGTPVLFYLTAMGIGHLGLCDGDIIKLSNLNRQILYTVADIGKPKASTAKKRLIALNPGLKATVYDTYMDKQLANEIVKKYDIIIDCLDNFETRFILNDACISAGKPMVHAGVGEFYGQLMTIIPGKSPCLRCLFPNGIHEKSEKVSGIIGPIPGVIGAMQALEAAKYFLGLQLCSDGLVTYDGLTATLEKVEIKQSINCICNI